MSESDVEKQAVKPVHNGELKFLVYGREKYGGEIGSASWYQESDDRINQPHQAVQK